MKKKIIGSVLVLGIVAAAAGLFVPNAVQKITKESVITEDNKRKRNYFLAAGKSGGYQ